MTIAESPPTLSSNRENREYWLTHIKNWKQSGLKQQAYCTQAGIRYSTFVYWRGMTSSAASPLKKKRFARVEVIPDKPSLLNVPQAIQIKLLTGHTVYIPTTLGIKDIAGLITLLGEDHA